MVGIEKAVPKDLDKKIWLFGKSDGEEAQQWHTFTSRGLQGPGDTILTQRECGLCGFCPPYIPLGGYLQSEEVSGCSLLRRSSGQLLGLGNS